MVVEASQVPEPSFTPRRGSRGGGVTYRAARNDPAWELGRPSKTWVLALAVQGSEQGPEAAGSAYQVGAAAKVGGRALEGWSRHGLDESTPSILPPPVPHHPFQVLSFRVGSCRGLDEKLRFRLTITCIAVGAWRRKGER